MSLSPEEALAWGGGGADAGQRWSQDHHQLFTQRTEAETTAKACQELGGETLVCQGDVSNDDDCRRIVAETIEKWGRVDGLMNNAGTTQFVADNSLEALSADDFLRIYHVNVVGAYQMARAVAPSMQEQGKGSIVNTSSIAGVMGIGSSIAYAASKVR